MLALDEPSEQSMSSSEDPIVLGYRKQLFKLQSARYSDTELRGLDFDGEAPDAAQLARRWQAILAPAREIIGLLPAEEAGRAVLARDGSPYRGEAPSIREALAGKEIVFHEGCIRGAFPRIVG